MGRPSLRELAEKGNTLRLHTLIQGAYSADEWLKRFRRLSELDQFRLWSSVSPRVVEGESGSQFRLIIEPPFPTGEPVAGELADRPALPPGPVSIAAEARAKHKPFPNLSRREVGQDEEITE